MCVYIYIYGIIFSWPIYGTSQVLTHQNISPRCHFRSLHCLDDKNHSVPWFTILLYRPFLGTATYSPWIWLNHNHSPREFQESLVHPAFLFPNFSNQTVVTMLMTVMMQPDFRYIINQIKLVIIDQIWSHYLFSDKPSSGQSWMVRVMPLSPHLRVEVPLLPPEKFRGLCILWKLYGYTLVTSDNLYTNNMSICWGGFVCFCLSGISISMIRLCSETKRKGLGEEFAFESGEQENHTPHKIANGMLACYYSPIVVSDGPLETQ